MSMFRAVFAILALLPSLALAQTVGYAVNSDDEADADQLLRVNLTTGKVTFIGPLPIAMEDVEGLAFDLDGRLYAVDNATKALFVVNPENATAGPVGNRRPNLGFSPTANMDFGMTFTCEGQLLLVAEETQSLYEVDPTTGQARVIGSSGGLGAPMTAIASYADQTLALASGGTLHKIDTKAGTSTLVGQIQGHEVTDAGLAFDRAGVLWAILDGSRSTGEFLPSKILRIDPLTAAAVEVAQTRTGIESLAVAPPSGCGLTGFPQAQIVPLLSLPGLIALALVLALVGWVRLRRV